MKEDMWWYIADLIVVLVVLGTPLTVVIQSYFREKKKKYRRSFVALLSDKPYYQTEQFLIKSGLLKELDIGYKNERTGLLFSFPDKMAKTWPLEVAYLVGSHLHNVAHERHEDDLYYVLKSAFNEAQRVYSETELQEFITKAGSRHENVASMLQCEKEEFDEEAQREQEEERFEVAFQRAL